MYMLSPVWVWQSAWNVAHDCDERLRRCVDSRRRLNELLKQGGADVPISARWLTLCFMRFRALNTDGHAAIIQERFCFTVSALCHTSTLAINLLRSVWLVNRRGKEKRPKDRDPWAVLLGGIVCGWRFRTGVGPNFLVAYL